jgi:hypothetical protein
MRRIVFASILVLLISGIASANGLSEAMDTSLIFETGGDAEWFSQPTTSHFDGDAAESGDVEDGQRSWMQTTVQGPGTLSFYWKVSSEANFDFLEFSIDSVVQERISGSVNWHQMIYSISDSGPHTLEWRYLKDGDVSHGNDLGRVDLVDWAGGSKPPSQPSLEPLSEALDTYLSVTTTDNASWFSQTAMAFFGRDAAQSGDVEHNQESYLQVAVDGAGTISFYWKVSSETDCDFLEFYIDGVLQDQISGLVDWHQMVYSIKEQGKHILEWRYVKDGSLVRNDDCGWVDCMKWPGRTQLVNPLSEALDTSLNLVTGGEADWLSRTDTAFVNGDAAQSGDVGDNQESYLQMAVDEAGTISFYWKVCSEAGCDFLEFYIDGVLQDQISGSVDWHQMVYTITAPGKHTLEWRYVKDLSIEKDDDCGWIDYIEWSGKTQPPLVNPLSEALDTSLNLTTDGEAEWLPQMDTAFFDSDAAQSGDVGDNQESFLQMAVDGAGTISFYWKVCSEAGYDFLEFYIDGVLQDQISGSIDWHQMVYTITGPGTHTLEWRYVKDVSIDGNDDCGWIDLVEWSDGT